MALYHVIKSAFLIFLLLRLANTNQPKVIIENGEIFGLYKKSLSGFIYKSFQGIPYAEPPIKENRFKEAIPYKRKWLGVWNATTPSSVCLQINQFIKLKNTYAMLGEEDCLYLNVYTRDGGDSNALKPVIVFIHPGGFSQTDAGAIGPEFLMDKDIVFVTFNYRLGVFGFLSTGDSVVPGNNGLKDQLCALKWIQSHIKAFGGDSNSVTITGLSAGAASVDYMMLTPLSDGLFHNAISFSGNALSPWSLIHDVPEKSKRLAALLGCPTSSAEMISCLKEKSGYSIMKQVKSFYLWLYNPFTIFGPVIEINSSNAIIPEHPADTINNRKLKNIPWIITVTSEEGLYPAAEFVFDHGLLDHLNKNWNDLAPYLLFYNDSIPQQYHQEIARKIKKEYMKHVGFSTTSRDEILAMMGDRLFVAPAVNTAFLVSQKRKEPVYVYMYRQKNSVAISSYFLYGTEIVIGASHADDVSLIFNLEGTFTLISDEDKEMSKILINLLVHFAKTGKVPQELNWNPALSYGGKFSYLNIRTPKEMDMVVCSNEILGNPRKLAEIFRKEKSAKVGMIFDEVKEKKNSTRYL